MRRAVLCNLQELVFPSPTVYLPYVCGALRAYAEQFDDVRRRWRFGAPLWRMQAVESMLDAVGEAPDLLGVSAYVWNFENSLRLAEAVKARWPHCFVVFGGPHVPNSRSDFLLRHPFVDACVHGEGEAAFVGVLRAVAGDMTLDEVAGLSFVRDGVQVFTAPGQRLKPLNFPSPYLAGWFDDWVSGARGLDSHPLLIACLETNRGCPYACAYCDWGMATMSKLRLRPEEIVRDELAWVAEQRVDVVLLNDANFGILPRDVGLMEYAAQLKRSFGFPRNFFPTGFAKNNKDRAFTINRLIIDHDMDPFGMNVNFSLQATSQQTLDAIDRENIPLENYRQMADLYGRSGYTLTPDLILPLPGETLASFCEGYADLCTWRQVRRIRVYPSMVLPNAPMAQPAYREKWGLLTVTSRISGQGLLRRNEAGLAPEWIETVQSTAHMSEDEHADAKVWVHFLNALELYRLTRPLRMASGLSAFAFYTRLMAWQLSHDGVLARGLRTIRELAHAHAFADEVALAGESETHDGLSMRHHKVLTYDALTRAGRFAFELKRFAASIGMGNCDALLSFQRDCWILPGFEAEDAGAYVFEYDRDYFAWLDGAEDAPQRRVRVTWARPSTWAAYRTGLTGWRQYALAEPMVDTFCAHGGAGRTVEVRA